MDDLLLKLRRIYPERYADIKRAYEYAQKAHEGQKRSSGEDYFVHPCAVAEILAEYGFDASTVMAAFLHDVLEDTSVTNDDLKAEFGEEIFELVDGVTKLDKLHFVNLEDAQNENLRKIFIAMAKDLRVIIIKFADRLHNMRSLEFLSPDRQLRIAKETLEIYAPLAGRLGISFFKCELEDLAMKYVYPDEYKYVSEAVRKQRTERQGFLEMVCKQIEDKLDEMGIKGEVNGRPKHLFSVYKKLNSLHIDIDQIYDLLAVRIIVDSVKDCYTILGEIHSMWKPIPGRVKDYIAMPKANNYQSLHTTVVTQYNETFEIQIRTREMHQVAEYGVAAHWKYKEGGADGSLEKKIRWIREVMVANDIDDSKEFMDAVKINVFDDEVFVFSPRGDVYDLPVESTPVDLAYKIHSAIGNKCVGAKVNKKIVPLSTKLETGDIVEIITSNSSKGPSLDWLKFVRTASCRAKIRAFFKKERRGENIERGKEMLEREAKKRGFVLGELLNASNIDVILEKHELKDIDDLYATVGFGGLTTNQVLIKLIDNIKATPKEEISSFDKGIDVEKISTKHSKNGILVNGNANFSVRIAQCCTPIPGDEIVGYISKGRGVSVHRIDCENIKGLETERLVNTTWDVEGLDKFNAQITIVCENKAGILAIITNVVAQSKLEIVFLNARVNEKKETAEIVLSVQINMNSELERLIKKLNEVEGIISIRR